MTRAEREKLHPHAPRAAPRPPTDRWPSGGAYRTMGSPVTPSRVRSCPDRAPIRAPEEARARDPSVPCPSLRPGRGRGPRQRSSRRRTTSSATTCTGRCSSAIPATRSAWTCPRRSRARTPTSATGGPRGRCRRGARTARCTRTAGPSIYVYEQVYRVPGTDHERTQRGFFARLRIEPFGPESRRPAARAHAVRAQGGSLPAPARDRRSTRRRSWACSATRTGEAAGVLARVVAGDAGGRPDRRRRRRATACGSSRPTSRDPTPTRCCGSRATGPVWIADGHHRYETAVRYRDERRWRLGRGRTPRSTSC